jgi:hypothetical protein
MSGRGVADLPIVICQLVLLVDVDVLVSEEDDASLIAVNLSVELLRLAL